MEDVAITTEVAPPDAPQPPTTTATTAVDAAAAANPNHDDANESASDDDSDDSDGDGGDAGGDWQQDMADLRERVTSVTAEKERLQTHLEKSEHLQSQLVETLRNTQAMLNKLHEEYQKQTVSNERLITQVGKEAFGGSKQDYDRYILASMTEHDDSEIIDRQYSVLLGNIDEVIHSAVTAFNANNPAQQHQQHQQQQQQHQQQQQQQQQQHQQQQLQDDSSFAVDSVQSTPLGGGDLESGRSSAAAALHHHIAYTEQDVLVPPMWSPQTFTRQLYSPSVHRTDLLLPHLSSVGLF